MRRLFRRLLTDRHGATAVEFALITPALMVALMGLFDLTYNMYTNQMLQGAIQQAARNSSLQNASGNQSTLDARVTAAVRAISPYATVQFTRTSYANFTDVNRPEDYTDVNANGRCDNGEPYEDANANSSWDVSPGRSGFGGARDAVLYTVSVTYDRAFPIYAFIPGQTKSQLLRTATVLRNQPYAMQATSAVTVRNCP